MRVRQLWILDCAAGVQLPQVVGWRFRLGGLEPMEGDVHHLQVNCWRLLERLERVLGD